GKVPGTRNIERVVAAERGLVVVEDGEGQILDIHADAIAEHKQQDEAADEGEGGADRVAAQFQHFAPRIAHDAARIEDVTGGGAVGVLGTCRRKVGNDRLRFRL